MRLPADTPGCRARTAWRHHSPLVVLLLALDALLTAPTGGAKERPPSISSPPPNTHDSTPNPQDHPSGAVPPAQRLILTPSEAAVRLQARFDQLRDYECLIRSETRAVGQVQAATFRLWYRRPGLLRLRVLRGPHQDSELVIDPDGVLRGRRGGLLRPFSRRLSRSDPTLRSLRGQPAWELDFGSFIRSMRERMALPGSSATVHLPTAAEPHLELEVRYRPVGASGFLRDVWWIDPREWLLTRGDVFDGETRVDHVEFADLRVDQGLKESWFRF